MEEKTCSYQLPIGPIHPALKEPFLFKFNIDGEKISGVELVGGKVHRGIEWMGMRRNPIQVVYLAERICGICSAAHSFAFCSAIEDAAGIEVPDRAHYIRSIIGELERIHSHLLWAGVAAHEIGFDSLLYYTWRVRENVMDLLEILSGNRVNYGMYMIGGVRRDIPPEKTEKIKSSLKYYNEAFRYLARYFLEDRTVDLRTRDTGVLTREDALKLTAVGPTARASGVKFDVRQAQPYAAYGDVDIHALTPEDYGKKAVGDIYDRILVRLLEVKQSCTLIESFLDQLPSGKILAEQKPIKILSTLKKASGEGIGKVEAPRGELIHWVRLNQSENLDAWKARSPTYNNLLSWKPMFMGEQIADIPIVAASTDPCFSCTDRVILTHAGKNKFESLQELHRLSVKKTRMIARKFRTGYSEKVMY